MSVWRSLKDYTLELIEDLDAAFEHVGNAIEKNIAPHVQGAAAQLDGAIERVFNGRGDKLGADVRRRALALDRRYQEFVVKRIDPLFGQTRTAQLEQMGSLQISPAEVSLNRTMAVSVGLVVGLVIADLLFPPLLWLVVPAAFVTSLPVYKRAIDSVKQQRRVTYHVISALNVTIVFLGGFYRPAITFMVFYYLGEKLLVVTEDRSHKGLISVFAQQPRTVWILNDGVEVEVAFETISRGDVILVHAGGFVPVDGTVVAGYATIDQHALTGEAQPAEKGPGDTVYASTVVLAGKVHVRVEKAGDETVAAKIGEVLNRTASYQLALQSRGSKIAHNSALPTLALSAAALPLGLESSLAVLNSTFGVSVRVSAPVAMLNLFNIASAESILMKDGRSLELLTEVDTVLFDKTGTLTVAQPNVAEVYPTGKFAKQEVLMFAAAAEHRQTHPIALAILEEAKRREIVVPNIDHAQYEVGYGIKVKVGARTVQVGSDRYMATEGISVPAEIMQLRADAQAKGNSTVMVAVNGVLAGTIELQPTLRPEAERVIAALRQRGLKLAIISGDQEEPTRRLAEKLGMDQHFANVLPEGKASLVEKLQQQGRHVCFVGDGINDSIALKKANVSVSLRGATTVATDAAQVVLMQESLDKLPVLFELADDMDRCMRWGYAAGMIPGVINVASVFFLGTGYPFALTLTMASLAAGMGIAVYPRFKYASQLAAAAATPKADPKGSTQAALDTTSTPHSLPA